MKIPANDVSMQGAKEYQGNESSKQLDQAFEPSLRMNSGNSRWQTLLVETGTPQSLQGLRMNASWWLEESHGEVKIALLLILNIHARTIILEKWERTSAALNGPNTRSMTEQCPQLLQQQSAQPICVQTITLTSTSATGDRGRERRQILFLLDPLSLG